MSLEESYDVETQDAEGGASRPAGGAPSSSAKGKVVFGVLLALLVAGVVVYRGVTTRARAAEDVKADTQELAVPAVSLAQPKLGAPQEIME